VKQTPLEYNFIFARMDPRLIYQNYFNRYGSRIQETILLYVY